MNFEEFAEWLRLEAQEGRLTEEQAEDAIRQRSLFDANRQYLEPEFRNQVAGYVNDKLVSDGTVPGILDLAGKEFPGSMLYFEAIGRDWF